LARERTILAWQRNRLSEMTVLLGAVGLGMGVHRFYAELQSLELAIVGISLVSLGYTVWRYFSVKRECIECRVEAGVLK